MPAPVPTTANAVRVEYSVPGGNVAVYARKQDADGTQGDWWNDTTAAFVASEPADVDKLVDLSDTDQPGLYVGTIAQMETHTGLVEVIAVNKDDANAYLGSEDWYLESGLRSAVGASAEVKVVATDAITNASIKSDVVVPRVTLVDTTTVNTDMVSEPLDAAGTRAALGMAAADLDDQLNTLASSTGTVSTKEVAKVRTFRMVDTADGAQARNEVQLKTGKTVTLAALFGGPTSEDNGLLNPGTAINTGTCVVSSGSAITITNVLASGDRKALHADFNASTSGQRTILWTANTTDAQAISGTAIVQVD